MGYKIILRKRFANDLTNLLVYLEHEWGKKVADEFQDKVDNAIELLKHHPHVGAPSRRFLGARGLLITKHNRLFYRVEKNTISIILLADTRMKNYNT